MESPGLNRSKATTKPLLVSLDYMAVVIDIGSVGYGLQKQTDQALGQFALLPAGGETSPVTNNDSAVSSLDKCR